MQPREFSILAVDDEASMLAVYRALLSEYALRTAGSLEEARRKLAVECIHLLLLDLSLPGEQGMSFLAAAPEAFPDLRVIVVTSDDTAASGVRAMKLGALDYVVKPFDDEEMSEKVKRVFATAQREGVLRAYEETPASGTRPLIGESPAMMRVKELIGKASQSGAPVLIQGESGTGKELIARAIHAHSQRAERDFVPVNCGAFPDTLINSELFGHEKGAFTGAAGQRRGCFEQAHQGTLFLDELCSLPLEAQVKILRALEEKTIVRVGGEEQISVDVRIVAATNSDIRQLVECGKFRDDLFYRLDVIRIPVPPLRTRGDDLLLLAEHFLRKYNAAYGRSVRGFSPELEAVMRFHNWGGNVRELDNFVHRLLLDCEGDLLLNRVAIAAGNTVWEGGLWPNQCLSLAEAQRMFRRSYVKSVVAHCDGDRRKAADLLGAGLTTVYRLMAEEGDEPSAEGGDEAQEEN